ncbi:hypothetical protein CPB83DRAFT_881859 [Crepidotus variabilis]|uniref:Uncharacterized protein n=1 Tax=Crepidotus variabilis TaxID=179855 RepID=A0A9P6JSN6_9AGAR|nr:hypothetical protein CPB83DRAFT_881859 [Crepidotus variabilis]
MAIQQSLPAVPLDIFELIIGTLASSSDLASIKSLCLANTSLVHLCRKEIFGTLEIKPKSWPDRPIEQFMPIYFARQTIASYIRDLRLWVEFHDHKSLDVAVSLLGSRHLKNVRSFQLGFKEDLSFSPTRKEMTAIPDQFVNALCKFITTNSIERLELWQINGFPITLFNYLPHLRELLLYNVGFAQTHVPNFLRKRSTCVPRLRELHLKRNISSALLDILNQKIPVLDLGHLEDLMIYLEDEYGKEMLNTRLFSTPQTLKKIIVGGTSPQLERLKHFAENIHPKSLRTLQTLSFSVLLEKSGQDPLASIIDELTAISGQTTLENLLLSIAIDWDIRCPVTADVWGRLESVLVPQGSFPALKRVTIGITITQYESRDHEEFKAQLEDIGRNYLTKLDKAVDLTIEVGVTIIRQAEMY